MRLSPRIKHQIPQPHKSFFYIYIFFEPDYSDLAYGTRNTVNCHVSWRRFFLLSIPYTVLGSATLVIPSTHVI